jgi:hypothetical protein
MMITMGKQKNTEKNLIHCHFFRHESYFRSPGIEPGLRGEKPASRWLSYDTVRTLLHEVQIELHKVP